MVANTKRTSVLPISAGKSLKKVEKTLPHTAAFPIVAIGASAGGLKPVAELLQNLPADIGMAFIIVQHLDPNHQSMMADIFSRATKMPVHEITDGMTVQPNHIYVMPENVGMVISEGILKLHTGPSEIHSHKIRMPIDDFFHSLAQDVRNKAIGVILSGTASDGSRGLMAIKEAGGITFAQDEESAEFNSMPYNAISTGCVDYVSPPKDIAERLFAISKHPYINALEKETNELLIPNDPFLKILKLLEKISSIKFTNYKSGTIKRRVMRRMVLHQLESLNDYVSLLEKKRDELEALLQDVLIHVTQFFRDPETFEILKEDVFPALIRNRSEGMPIRIWVVGCSTGEEAYSIAIALFEFLGDRSNDFPIQIFATDAKDYCIDIARKGIYPQNIKFNVSNERLRRFFVKVGNDYQIIKSIRDTCIFAKQNILADPPYSKMDIISCRNLLIYFDHTLQQSVLPTLHYGLKPKGFLVLGTSESVTGHTDLFQLFDKTTKIYTKKLTKSKNHLNFAANPLNQEKFVLQKPKTVVDKMEDIFKQADRVIFSKYKHAGVVINENMDVLQFRGDTSFFLNNLAGFPSTNLFKIAVDGLRADLHILIQKAGKEGRTFKNESVRIQRHGHSKDVSLEVIPLKDEKARYYLILFVLKPPLIKVLSKSKAIHKNGKKIAERNRPETRIKELENELIATKTYLQSIIEEKEVSNRELQFANEESQSSNEEFQSMNEELQSTNEELETAKEELQATNEEMTTINDELQTHISQLTLLTDDLTNLLTSVHLPIIMVGKDLRIRRFTHSAEKILRLIPTDIGRSLTDLKFNIKLPLDAVVLEVMTTASAQVQEVQDDEGKWYLIHVRPYKTSDNKIDGAIIIMTDIDVLRKSQELLEIHQVMLEVSNKELEQFAYVASHDLQEPLRVIVMSLELLKRRYKDALDVGADEFINGSIENAKRSEKMIRDLLEYAKIGTDKTLLKMTDFESILKRSLSDLELAVLESGAEITHDPLPELMADPFQMGQLFQNLLSNAIKYKGNEPLKIHISAKKEGKKWLFSVKDNGIGIDSKYKDKIFALFQRLHTKREHSGTGIGLSICKKIVERHGGAIWMESQPNEGSTFYFTIYENISQPVLDLIKPSFSI